MSFDPNCFDPPSNGGLSRRRFVQGMALGGVAATTGLWRSDARASNPVSTPVLRGSSQTLQIGRMPVNLTGRPRPAITVNQSLPAPTLRWREGDTVSVRVRNALADQPTSVHWHGLLLPANMDGVPGMSFDGIAPGQEYHYRFALRQSGTYWYHSHSMFQEQAGLYGAIVIDPLTPPPYRHDREHVVLLSDWTDLDPAALFRRLKQMPSHDNYAQRTVGDFLRDARDDGLRATLADRGMWGRMRMTPTDLSDVNANTYTYLLNGVAPAGNWTGLFKPGEKVLLRFINGSSMTYFDIRIPGLRMTVVAADGQYVHPVSVDEPAHCGGRDLRRARRAHRPGCVYRVRAGHGPHRIRLRHAGGAAWAAGTDSRAGSARDPHHAGHGARRWHGACRSRHARRRHAAQ